MAPVGMAVVGMAVVGMAVVGMAVVGGMVAGTAAVGAMADGDGDGVTAITAAVVGVGGMVVAYGSAEFGQLKTRSIPSMRRLGAD